MEKDIELFVDADGTAQAVYSDELVDLFPGATLETRRASHVEPHPTKSGWFADMIPSGGPVLGADGAVIHQWEFANAGSAERADALWNTLAPFPTRQAALDAERAWLDARMKAGRL